MLSLKGRLLSVEEDFLASMLKGDDAMSAFDQRWQTLLDDIDHVMESNATTIDYDIPALAFTVASRVASLADTSVALLTACDTISSDLVDQLSCLISELRMDDPPTRNLSERNVLSSESHRPDAQSHTNLPLSSRKRRRESSEDVSHAVHKRSRTSLPPGSATSIGRLPSLSPPPVPPMAPAVANSVSTSVSGTSRKRRCSDADASTFPSSCKRLHVGPRLHVVSDSFVLPRTSASTKSSPVQPRSPPLPDTTSAPIDSSSTLPIALHLDPLPHFQAHGSLDLTSLLSTTETSFDPTALSMMLPTVAPLDDDIREWLGTQELFLDTFIPLSDSPFSSASPSPCTTPPLMPALDLGAPLYQPLNLTSSGVDWCTSCLSHPVDGHSSGIGPCRSDHGDSVWVYDQVGGDDGLAERWPSLLDSLDPLQPLPLLCYGGESSLLVSEQRDEFAHGGITLDSSQLGIISCS